MINASMTKLLLSTIAYASIMLILNMTLGFKETSDAYGIIIIATTGFFIGCIYASSGIINTKVKRCTA